MMPFMIKHQDLYLHPDSFTSGTWTDDMGMASIFYDVKYALSMKVAASRWLKVPLDEIEIEIVEGES